MSGGEGVRNPADLTPVLNMLFGIEWWLATGFNQVLNDIEVVDGVVDAILVDTTAIELAVAVIDGIVDTILVDVAGLDGAAMRGTDDATLQATWTDALAAALANYTAARADYLDELAPANIPADIDTLLARLTALRAGYLDELGPTNLPSDIDDIWLELHHRSLLYPDLSTDIDLTCTFTSGAIDAFGAWAEIDDSGATTFSSLCATDNVHISALRIRTVSETDVLYVIELGYGPNAGAVTIFDVHEFGSGTKHIDSDEQARFRPPAIPAGQNVYYRMKTEDTANATTTIVLRYHID